MRLEIKYENVHENCQWHNRPSWAYEFSPTLFIDNTTLTLVRDKIFGNISFSPSCDYHNIRHSYNQ